MQLQLGAGARGALAALAHALRVRTEQRIAIAMSFKGLQKAVARTPQIFSKHQSETPNELQPLERQLSQADRALDTIILETKRFSDACVGMIDAQVAIYTCYGKRTEELAPLRVNVLHKIETLKHNVMKPCTEMKSLLQGVRQNVSKRDHKKLDFDRYTQAMGKHQAQPAGTAKHDRQYETLSTDLQKATLEYNKQNEMLTGTLPSVTVLLQRFLEPIVNYFYSFAYHLYATLHTHMIKFAEKNDIDNSPEATSVQHLTGMWRKGFEECKYAAEDGLSLIKQGRIAGRPMSDTPLVGPSMLAQVGAQVGIGPHAALNQPSRVDLPVTSTNPTIPIPKVQHGGMPEQTTHVSVQSQSPQFNQQQAHIPNYETVDQTSSIRHNVTDQGSTGLAFNPVPQQEPHVQPVPVIPQATTAEQPSDIISTPQRQATGQPTHIRGSEHVRDERSSQQPHDPSQTMEQQSAVNQSQHHHPASGLAPPIEATGISYAAGGDQSLPTYRQDTTEDEAPATAHGRTDSIGAPPAYLADEVSRRR